MDNRGEEFAEFVRQRSDGLLELAWLVTRDPRDAEDAVQEALAGLFRSWDRVPKGAELEPYLYRSLVNASLRVIRRRPRELSVAAPEQVPGTAIVDDPTAGSVLAGQVWRLCGDLSPLQRSAIVLRYRRDLDFAAIGRILGCREATARSHVHRALTRLRSIIAEEDGHGTRG